MKSVIYTFCIILLGGTWGCAGIQYTDKVQALDITQIDKKEASTRVLAIADEWRNSGVIVKKGYKYKIIASGKWTAGTICGWTEPDGLGISPTCSGATATYIGYGSASLLLGRIGEQGNLFFVGNGIEMNPEEDGTLFFRINDIPIWMGDNDGYVDVATLLVSPAVEQVSKYPQQEEVSESKAWLGVSVQPVTPELAKQFGLKEAKGAMIADVAKDGPADKAGIRRGDVILEFNRKPIAEVADLPSMVASLKAGDNALLLVNRTGSMMYISAKLEASPIKITKEIKEEPTQKLPPDTKLPPLRSDTYAVIIGIDYKDRKDIPNLQYPSQDAKKVYGILTDARYGGIPKENTILLLNEKATRNEMIAALRKIKTWDGYVYVYYSGHGAPKTKEDKFIDGFLVPNDVVIIDPEAMEETSIKISYLQDLVDSSQAKGVMVALDACFSGGGKSIVPKGGKPLVGMLVSPELIKPKGTGKIIITSSAINQQSWEDETELKSGIFSYYLLEGLKGKAGKDVWVKVDELADYIKDNVSKAARKLKGQEQNPQISGKGDFAVTRNWEKAKVMDIEIARAKLKNAFEKGNMTAEQLKKAMDELKTQTRSKTLEAFLEGKINEKEFGELY